MNANRKELPATVFDHSLFKANTGSAGIQVIAEVNEDGKLRIREGTLWLTPAAIERTAQTLLRTFGYDGDLADLNDGQALSGKKFIAVMDTDDRGREKIAFFNSLGHSRRATPDEALGIAAEFSGLLDEARARAKENSRSLADEAAGTPAATPAPVAATASTPANLNNDDLPF